MNSIGREGVDFEDGAEATGIGFGETAVSGDAGVVDEDIEAAELLACGSRVRAAALAGR